MLRYSDVMTTSVEGDVTLPLCVLQLSFTVLRFRFHSSHVCMLVHVSPLHSELLGAGLCVFCLAMQMQSWLFVFPQKWHKSE